MLGAGCPGESNTDPLQEQKVFLIAGPSLQLSFLLLISSRVGLDKSHPPVGIELEATLDYMRSCQKKEGGRGEGRGERGEGGGRGGGGRHQ